MKIKIQKSQFVLNIFTKCMSLVISFITTLLITKMVVIYIGELIYGFYSLSNDFVNYAMIISIGLNSMSGRFVSLMYYQKKYDNANGYFNSIFYANIILAAIMLIPSIIVLLVLPYIINIPNEILFDVRLLFIFMFLNFFIIIISSVFSVSTFIKNRVDFDSLRSIESNVIKCIFIFIMFKIFKAQIWYLGLATCISSMYVFVRNIFYTKKLTPEISIFNTKYFNLKYLIEVIKSGIWNSVTRIGAIFLNGLDLLLANIFVSASGMSILSIAKIIPKLMLQGMASIAGVFSPKITSNYAKESRKISIEYYIESVKICALLSIVIQAIIIVLGKQIFELWVSGENIEKIYMLCVIAMLGYIVILPLEPSWAVITATNQVKISSIYLFLESTISIICVLIFLQFVENELLKLIAITGISSIAEILRGLIFLPIFTAKCLKAKTSDMYRLLIRIILANLICDLIGIILFSNLVIKSWLELIIYFMIVSLISIVLWWIIILTKNEHKRYCKELFLWIGR